MVHRGDVHIPPGPSGQAVAVAPQGHRPSRIQSGPLPAVRPRRPYAPGSAMWRVVTMAALGCRQRRNAAGKLVTRYRVRWREPDGQERSRTFEKKIEATRFRDVLTADIVGGSTSTLPPARSRSRPSPRSGSSHVRRTDLRSRRASPVPPRDSAYRRPGAQRHRADNGPQLASSAQRPGPDVPSRPAACHCPTMFTRRSPLT